MELKDRYELLRRGERDLARLESKIREAIKKDIRKYITEEAIITVSGEKKVKIPVRGLELPEFRYGSRSQGVGSGRGDAKEGDKFVPVSGSGEPGEGAAEHILEKEVTIDELVAIAFEELGLPNLDDKVSARVRSRHPVFNQVRRTGAVARLDVRRTLKENLLRNAREHGAARVGGFERGDLRFKSYEEEVVLTNNALIVAMMDVSGSMTEHKKYLVRMTLFWIKKYLERLYDGLEFLFIIHDTKAQVVGEELFFNTTTGGGTYISSAYDLALSTIRSQFPPSEWNIYPFYFSDGENWEDDNKKAVELATRLAAISRMFYYGQVASTNYATFMKTITKGLEGIDNLVTAEINEEKDIVTAIKQFLRKT